MLIQLETLSKSMFFITYTVTWLLCCSIEQNYLREHILLCLFLPHNGYKTTVSHLSSNSNSV